MALELSKAARKAVKAMYRDLFKDGDGQYYLLQFWPDRLVIKTVHDDGLKFVSEIPEYVAHATHHLQVQNWLAAPKDVRHELLEALAFEKFDCPGGRCYAIRKTSDCQWVMLDIGHDLHQVVVCYDTPRVAEVLPFVL